MSQSPPLRLDVTLRTAFAHRVFHFVQGSEIQGNVVLVAALVIPASGTVRWSTRIAGRHETRPSFVTSQDIEEALNGAYCQALASLAASLSSPEAEAVWR